MKASTIIFIIVILFLLYLVIDYMDQVSYFNINKKMPKLKLPLVQIV